MRERITPLSGAAVARPLRPRAPAAMTAAMTAAAIAVMPATAARRPVTRA